MSKAQTGKTQTGKTQTAKAQAAKVPATKAQTTKAQAVKAKTGKARMSKAETGEKIFAAHNCAQAVIGAYAEDYGLDKGKALSVAVGFGAGMSRLQETCGAVTGAIMVLGLASGFKEGDSREKVNHTYKKVRSFVEDFTAEFGTVNCRKLLGCNLLTDEGQSFFVKNNLKDKCCGYVKYSCEHLDKYLAE